MKQYLYQEPEFKIFCAKTEDVITTSGEFTVLNNFSSSAATLMSSWGSSKVEI